MSQPLNNLKLALLCGSILSLSIPSLAVEAVPKVNPCPRIYYEEPYNSNVIVPNGCPSNAATKTERVQSVILPSNSPQTIQSIPDNQQRVIARVTPLLGQVSMKLKNDMQTEVIYQAIGETSQRSLKAGQEVMLKNLPLPMTLTLNRTDGGLVRLVPMPMNTEGMLDISIKEANGLNDSHLNLNIQTEGQVSAY